MNQIFIFYGPPASGKDTITRELPDSFELFVKAKMGSGRTEGYDMISQYPDVSDIVSKIERYDNHYFILGSALENYLKSGINPVVHTTQVDEILALKKWAKNHGTSVFVVELRNSFAQFWERSLKRKDKDTNARSAIWFRAYEDSTSGSINADLEIDTDITTPREAASLIAGLKRKGLGYVPYLASPIVIPAVRLSLFDDEESARRYMTSLYKTGADILVGGPTARHLGKDSGALKDELHRWSEIIPSRRLMAISYKVSDPLITVTRLVLPAADELAIALQESAEDPSTGVYITGVATKKALELSSSDFAGVGSIKADKTFMASKTWDRLLGTEVRTIESSAANMLERLKIAGSRAVTVVNSNLFPPAQPIDLDTLAFLERRGRALRVGTSSNDRLEKLESLLVRKWG